MFSKLLLSRAVLRLVLVLLLTLACHAHADLGDSRTFEPLPQGAGLSAIVSDGAGKFAAVGEHGNVMVSTDLQTWKNTGFGVDVRLRAITHADGKFVAVGGESLPTSAAGKIYVSSDGLSWSTQTFSDVSSVDSIAFGNGKFVAGCNATQGVVYTSPDAVSWTRHLLTQTGIFTVSRLRFLNGKFYALVADERILVSADGINWTEAAIPPSEFQGVRIADFAYGAGKYVAVCTQFGAAEFPLLMRTSVDGLTWSALTSIGRGRPTSIVYRPASAHFLLVGESTYNYSGQGGGIKSTTAAMILSSADALDWTSELNEPRESLQNVALFDVALDGENILAVGVSRGRLSALPVSQGRTDEPGSLIYASGNSKDWGFSIRTQIRFEDVTFGGGRFVAVGGALDREQANPAIINSTRPAPIVTSPDGLTWTPSEVGVSALLRGVAFGGSTYVAIGSASGQPIVFTSSNSAQSWVPNSASVAVQGLATLADVAFGNGVFVAVGDRNQAGTKRAAILTSSTPTAEWQAWTVPDFISELYDVAFGGGRFVAVGKGTGPEGVNQHLTVVSTDNGQTWTPYFPDLPGAGYFETIAFKENVFVAGGDRVAYSSDGTVWAQALANTDSSGFIGFSSVAATGDQFQVIGLGYSFSADDVTPYYGLYSSSNGQSFGDPTLGRLGSLLYSSAWANDRFVVAGDGGKINSYATTPPPLQPPVFPGGVFAQKAKVVAGKAASFLIGTTGGMPATYAASGLPAGLTLNTATGVISGTATKNGQFTVQLTASNSAGTASGTVTIFVLLDGLVTIDLIPGADTYAPSSVAVNTVTGRVYATGYGAGQSARNGVAVIDAASGTVISVLNWTATRWRWRSMKSPTGFMRWLEALIPMETILASELCG